MTSNTDNNALQQGQPATNVGRGDGIAQPKPHGLRRRLCSASSRIRLPSGGRPNEVSCVLGGPSRDCGCDCCR